MNQKINLHLSCFVCLLLLTFSFDIQGQTYEDAIKLYNKGQYQESLGELEKCLPIYAKQYGRNDTAFVTRILFHAAVCHYYGGAPAKGLQLLLKADSIYTELDAQTSEYASICNAMGGMNGYLGKYDEAIACHTKAINLFEELNETNTNAYATTLNNIGLIYRIRGQYEKAMEYFNRSRITFENRDLMFTVNYSLILRNIGLVHSLQGEHLDALRYYNKGLSILDSIGHTNSSIYISLKMSCTDIFTQEGEYTAALNENLKLLELVESQKTSNRLKEGEIHYKIGNSYYDLYDMQLAYEHLTKAKNIYIECEMFDTNVLADIYYYLSKYHYTRGEYKLALENITNANEILIGKKVAESNYFFISYQFHTANIEIATGNVEAGLNRMNKTLQAINIEENENPKLVLNLMLTIAEQLYDHKNMVEAKQQLESALDFTMQKQTEFHHEDMLKLILLCYKVDKQMISNNQLCKGIKYYIHSLLSAIFSETYYIRQSQILKNELLLKELSSLIFEDSVDKQISANVFHAVETIKSLLKYRAISSESLVDNAESRKLLSEYIDLRKKIALNTQSKQATGEIVNFYKNKLSTLELELTDKHIDTTFLSVISSSSYSDFKKHIKKNEAVISLITYQKDGKDHYGAIICKSNLEYPIAVKLASKQELLNIRHEAFTWAREHSFLSTPDDQDIVNYLYSNTESHGLYLALWKTISPYLDHVDHIYISPVDELNYIAFDAIPIGNKCLIDKYNIEYVNSAWQIINRPEELYYNTNTSVTLFGEMNYDLYSGNDNETNALNSNNYQPKFRSSSNNNWHSLGEHTEIIVVADLFKENSTNVKLFTGTKATEENFLLLDSNAPDILHLSTHACYNSLVKYQSNITDSIWYQSSPDPMLRSFLVMSGANNEEQLLNNHFNDGKLTAYEISNLDLSQTRLAVLAACDTGLGENISYEGVQGLRTAFKLAGVDYLIVSQWQVPNSQTSELMTLFYHNWIVKKLEVMEAFIYAKKEMRNKYPNNPNSWAGFQLVY